MIPYFRPKLSHLYTLSHSKLLENNTLHRGTYIYNSYMAVPPPGGGGRALHSTIHLSKILQNVIEVVL